MEIKDIIVKKTSPKGAALVEYGGKQTWLKPSQMKKIGEGKLTPSIIKAINEAKPIGEPMTDKKAYYSVKGIVKAETEKAMLIRCYNGKEGWVPYSQIIEGNKDDEVLIPCWLVEKNNLQHASKKIWI